MKVKMKKYIKCKKCNHILHLAINIDGRPFYPKCHGKKIQKNARRTCVHCGSVMKSLTKFLNQKRKFCCIKCATAYWYRTQIDHTCLTCGISFIGPRKRQGTDKLLPEYCSFECEDLWKKKVKIEV